MEKNTPHHQLEVVKSLVRARALMTTRTALRSAHSLGFAFDDILNVVLSLSRSDFYKSMTSYADHREWQDVYHVATRAGQIYLKLTIRNNVLVLSFKEL